MNPKVVERVLQNGWLKEFHTRPATNLVRSLLDKQWVHEDHWRSRAWVWSLQRNAQHTLVLSVRTTRKKGGEEAGSAHELGNYRTTYLVILVSVACRLAKGMGGRHRLTDQTLQYNMPKHVLRSLLAVYVAHLLEDEE